MAYENLKERRACVDRLVTAGINFEPSLIKAFAVAFGCSTRAIRVDL